MYYLIDNLSLRMTMDPEAAFKFAANFLLRFASDP